MPESTRIFRSGQPLWKGYTVHCFSTTSSLISPDIYYTQSVAMHLANDALFLCCGVECFRVLSILLVPGFSIHEAGICC